MSGGGRKFLAAALLPFLVMVATSETGVPNPAALAISTSTASTTPVAVNKSPQPEPQLHLSSVPGCHPKKLMDAIVTNCQDSLRSTMTPTDKCCIVAVGIVARPACYCLVKQELAFKISPLLNKTNMLKLIANCGATPLLENSLDTPCGGSSHDDQTMGSSHGEQTMGHYGCAVLETVTILNGCSFYKIATFIVWPLIAILIAVVLWLMFWSPVPVAPVSEGKKALIEGKKVLRW